MRLDRPARKIFRTETLLSSGNALEQDKALRQVGLILVVLASKLYSNQVSPGRVLTVRLEKSAEEKDC